MDTIGGNMGNRAALFKLFLLIFFSNQLSGAVFLDDDLDGVANEDDKCPNSKITDIVNKYGCAVDKVTFKKSSTIDISIGFSRQRVANSSWENAQNLSFAYSYNNSAFWLTYSNYSDSSYNTLTFATYYNIDLNNSLLTLGAGVYIPANSNIDDKSDYFISAKYSYFFAKSSVSLEYMHQFSNDSNTQDSNSLSLEYGYLFDNKLYLSLSYRIESSIYKDESTKDSLGVFTNYNLNKNWYISAHIEKDLSNISNISYTFLIGYTF